MEVQPERENASYVGDDAILLNNVKVKLEPIDVVVDTEPMEPPEIVKGEVKIGAANDEFVNFPPTSSESKFSVILKQKIKRRLSGDKPFDKHSKAKIRKRPSNCQPSKERKVSIKISIFEPNNEIKDEIGQELLVVGTEVKTLINMKNEIKKSCYNFLKPQRITNAESENETKPILKSLSVSRLVVVKPDRKKLMRTEVKCMKLQKMTKEEALDRKPDIQVRTGLKKEIKSQFKGELVVKGKEKQLVEVIIKNDVKNEELKECREPQEEKGD